MAKSTSPFRLFPVVYVDKQAIYRHAVLASTKDPKMVHTPLALAGFHCTMTPRASPARNTSYVFSSDYPASPIMAVDPLVDDDISYFSLCIWEHDDGDPFFSSKLPASCSFVFLAVCCDIGPRISACSFLKHRRYSMIGVD